jgi:hypothetical protein
MPKQHLTLRRFIKIMRLSIELANIPHHQYCVRLHKKNISEELKSAQVSLPPSLPVFSLPKKPKQTQVSLPEKARKEDRISTKRETNLLQKTTYGASSRPPPPPSAPFSSPLPRPPRLGETTPLLQPRETVGRSLLVADPLI